MANKLQFETSLYLQQHALNPVDWFPWGAEAFELAAKENKPVLVSIGYAACHWCHVMEHESFEQEQVAAFMNEHFVCIKVDREEHPDVDHLYMDALQTMTGSGGWPLNMFVTPDRKPFYGGTYFPPTRVYGRSSWMDVLQGIQQAWKTKPEEIALQAEQLITHLKQAAQMESKGASAFEWDTDTINKAVANLLQQADRVYGGFSNAPKFPATGAIRLLLEFAHYNNNREGILAEEAKQQALLSLDKMIEGGIYDQIGGGFSRYATDKAWLVPHFEKMLYDNALLIRLLADAFRLTAKHTYHKVITDTISFCYRELKDAHCPGFFCALDADSEGVEGKFYTWNWAQWQTTMPDVHPAVMAYYGVTKEGNWEHTNILHQAISSELICQRFALSASDWDEILEAANDVLFSARDERVRPATDDKMLLSWNALMNSALVAAGIALSREDYLTDAVLHMEWLLTAFAAEDGGYYHVYKNNEARIPAKMDDYAYLIEALLSLAAVTGKEHFVLQADKITDYCHVHFLDESRLFFCFSSDLQTDIVVRKVETYDGATPSANVIMMENKRLLGNLMENGAWLQQSWNMMKDMGSTAVRYPSSFSYWAVYLQRYQKGYGQLIISGPEAGVRQQEWQRRFAPEIYVFPSPSAYTQLPALQHKYVEEKTLLYLCNDFVCRPPVTLINELEV